MAGTLAPANDLLHPELKPPVESMFSLTSPPASSFLSQTKQHTSVFTAAARGQSDLERRSARRPGVPTTTCALEKSEGRWREEMEGEVGKNILDMEEPGSGMMSVCQFRTLGSGASVCPAGGHGHQ